MQEFIAKWLQNPVVVAGLITGIIGIIIRAWPKEKLLKLTLPWSGRAGRILSKLLNDKLGRKPAARIEEGIFVTIAAVLTENIKCFIDNLLMDNVKK